MQPRDHFARNLRQQRTRLKLTQEALANACDLHPTEVSRLERAVRDPRLSTIARLAHALEIPASRLLRGIR